MLLRQRPMRDSVSRWGVERGDQALGRIHVELEGCGGEALVEGPDDVDGLREGEGGVGWVKGRDLEHPAGGVFKEIAVGRAEGGGGDVGAGDVGSPAVPEVEVERFVVEVVSGSPHAAVVAYEPDEGAEVQQGDDGMPQHARDEHVQDRELDAGDHDDADHDRSVAACFERGESFSHRPPCDRSITLTVYL